MNKTILFCACLMLSGCGTLFGGMSQDIQFDSNVPGVDIYLDGQKVCQTPCSYPVSKGSSSVTIMAKKNGYEDQLDHLKSTFNPWTFLNISNAYFYTTDFVSGGMWKYNRKGIYINMVPKSYAMVDKKTFDQKSKIRHFILHTYPELLKETAQNQTGNYLIALQNLTNKDILQLKEQIKLSTNEVDCLNRILSL